MEFLRQEVEGEEQRSLVSEGFESHSDKTGLVKERRLKSKHEIPTAVSLYSSPVKEECLFCGKPGHSSSVCFKAKNMNISEKQQLVRSRKCCFLCLRPLTLPRVVRKTLSAKSVEANIIW